MQLKQEIKPKIEPFEFQNWEVYRKSICWVGDAQELLKNLQISPNLSDQLSRASSSIPLNLAEGSSRYTVRDKTNFWRIARGSVFECVAIIDVLRTYKKIDTETSNRFVTQLAEIGRMLSGLINWINKKEKEILKP